MSLLTSSMLLCFIQKLISEPVNTKSGFILRNIYKTLSVLWMDTLNFGHANQAIQHHTTFRAAWMIFFAGYSVSLYWFCDILIHGPTCNLQLTCIWHWLGLLQILIMLNAEKCSFGQTTIHCEGNVISAHGIATNLAKIEAMFSWSTHMTMKLLWGFLGLTGFIPSSEALCHNCFNPH